MQFVAAAAGKWNERWPDKAWCMSTIWGKWVQACRACGVLGHGGARQQCQQCHRIWTSRVTQHWPPPDHQWPGSFLRCKMIHGVTTWGWILTSSSFQLGPSIKFWLCLAGRGPSCGAPNYWPLSPAQFETNHPKTRWASGGRWRMEENTNSEIQSQDWYNQVADKRSQN